MIKEENKRQGEQIANADVAQVTLQEGPKRTNQQAVDMFEERPSILGTYYEVSEGAENPEGGMGKIFFCRDKRTMQFYALKTFSTRMQAVDKQKELKELFEKEARFSLSLGKHPNLVYTRTITEDNGRYYIVMELN